MKNLLFFFLFVLLAITGLPNQADIFEDAGRNNLTGVQQALDGGADIDAVNADKETALHCAVKANATEIVKFFLEHKANQKTRNRFGWAPIHDAITRGSLPIIELLLAQGKAEIANYPVKVEGDAETPLLIAIDQSSVKEPVVLQMVNLLLANGADVNKTGGDYYATPLRNACEKKFQSVALRLLDKGAKINGKDMPLITAAYAGDVTIVKAIIARGAKVKGVRHNMNGTPLHGAVESGSEELTKFFLSKGCSVNERCLWSSEMPLHIAIRKKNLALVKLLVAHKADVNARVAKECCGGPTKFDGDTPLALANKKGDKNIVNFLRQHRAK